MFCRWCCQSGSQASLDNCECEAKGPLGKNNTAWKALVATTKFNLQIVEDAELCLSVGSPRTINQSMHLAMH